MRRPLTLFTATTFLLEVQFWFPVWLLFLLDLGFGLPTAMLADAAFRLISVALEIPIGILADRLGRKRTYLTIALLTAVSFILIAFVTSTVTLFVAWAVWGVLWALNSGTASAYAYELTAPMGPMTGRRAFAGIRGAGQAAVFLSLVTAGILFAVDPRLPFLVTALMALVAALLILGLPDTSNDSPTDIPVSRILPTISMLKAWPVVLLGVLFFSYGWSVQILVQPLALDLGIPPEATGFMYAGMALAGMSTTFLAGWIPRRLVHSAPVWALALTAAGCTGTWVAPELAPYMWLPIISAAWGLGWTALEFAVSSATPSAMRATTLSIIAGLGGLVIAVSRPTLGLLSDAFDSAHAYGVWALVGLGLFLLVSLVAFVHRPRRAADSPR